MDHAVHKALNRSRVVLMGPGASRSSILRGLPDVSEGSEEMDVVTVLSREKAAMYADRAGHAGRSVATVGIL